MSEILFDRHDGSKGRTHDDAHARLSVYKTTHQSNRPSYLKTALVVFSLVFVIGLPVSMHLWPAGWTREPRQPEYEQMMMGIYGTPGIFLILASRDPRRHASIIRFTIRSSIVQGTIMLAQALRDPTDPICWAMCQR